jgi:hypothetical protein
LVEGQSKSALDSTNGKHDGGKLMERNSQLIDAFNNIKTKKETCNDYNQNEK